MHCPQITRFQSPVSFLHGSRLRCLFWGKVLESRMDTFVSLFLKVEGNVPPTLSRIPDLQHVLGCDQMFFLVTFIDQHPHLSQSKNRASAVAPEHIQLGGPLDGELSGIGRRELTSILVSPCGTVAGQRELSFLELLIGSDCAPGGLEGQVQPQLVHHVFSIAFLPLPSCSQGVGVYTLKTGSVVYY